LIRAALVTAVLALAGAAPAAAAPTLVEIGTFSSPVHVASPPGDERVFVVEQDGLVKIAGGGTFLDVTALTDGTGEQGLLSIAFSPDYTTTGLFYVFMTSNVDGALLVREYRRSADPNVADPASGRQILSVPHPTPAENHNGGQLQFGPDGMLYVSTGDGGDTPNNAQNTASELGKILRIDPRTGLAAAGNPFGRVWAYGLRNPWRFSFDRVTGDLLIGDVGQSAWEEVDLARAADGGGRSANFGWPACEGFACSPTGPFQPPAFARAQADGYCAITGGYVVRDPGLPTLVGRYLYGDRCLPALRSTALPDTGDREEPLAVAQVSSFGEDGCGRVHAVSHGGPVYRIQDGPPYPCTPAALPPPGPSPVLDRTKPRVRVSITGLRSAARRRQIKLRVLCDERCRIKADGRLLRVGKLRSAVRQLAANRRTTVRVRIGRNVAQKLRRAVRRRRVAVRVTVRARDTSANERLVRRRAQIPKRPRG
jgi:Glucose / Sorbosone dehydrogenase